MANKPNSKSAPRRARKAARAIDVLDQRIAGKSFRAIAADLGISKSSVHRDIVERLADLHDQTNNKAAELRALECERLDQLTGFAWKAASRGDVASILAVAKLSEQRARLLGLNTTPRPEQEARLPNDKAALIESLKNRMIEMGYYKNGTN